MITYAELKADVVGMLEIDNTDADRFLLDENLRKAQLTLLNTLPFRYLTNAIKTVKANLSNGVNLYQWPSDYVRFIEMWVDFTNPITASNEGRKIVEYEDSDFYTPTIGDLASKNYPYIDLNVEGGFGIYPVPDKDVTSGWRLRYVWQTPNPTAVQDCLLEYNLKNLLVYRTVELCAIIEEHNIVLSEKAGKMFTDELNLFLPKKVKQ